MWLVILCVGRELVDLKVLIITVLTHINDLWVYISPSACIGQSHHYVLVAVLEWHCRLHWEYYFLSLPTWSETELALIVEKHFKEKVRLKFVQINCQFVIVEAFNVEFRMDCQVRGYVRCDGQSICKFLQFWICGVCPSLVGLLPSPAALYLSLVVQAPTINPIVIQA